MTAETRTIDLPDLHRWVAEAFRSAGLGKKEAEIMSDCLTEADSRGASSHGVIRVPFLVARLRDGGARADASPQLLTEAPASAVVDGDAALGPISAHFAMTLATRKAAACGVGFVAVRNSDFIGTCAHSAMIALRHSMIGMTWTNGFPGMAPFSGAGAAIGNNPFGFAIPTGSGEPVVLDMAMSCVAGGRVRHAAKRGEDIPEGWIVDSEGRDTNDPNQLAAGGALLSLGHKGFGLAVIGEILCGVLAGAAILGEIPEWFRETDKPVGNGHVHLAIDIKRFVRPEDFVKRMNELATLLKQTPARDGHDEVLLPGERSVRCAAWHRRHGLDLPRQVADDLVTLAGRLGIAAPQFRSGATV
ncbi:Ldh family oxidoreductase [Hoeflea ulvae]|uniref:Ldh family oxidoreductase n=1 Tax=Hoeflea ulvae TaxID=2983764 RepID=A0ABT3YC18_9HYPH|nr:Ldh family oxidoreductase [Hoeflea ulvae]MCY0093423.1 Ldh family oxidoreductase [Hoeflea ulvae]